MGADLSCNGSRSQGCGGNREGLPPAPFQAKTKDGRRVSITSFAVSLDEIGADDAEIHRALLDAMWANYDKDHNGNLDLMECQAMTTDIIDGLVARCRTSDQALTKANLEQFKEQVVAGDHAALLLKYKKMFDVNRDGHVEKEEFLEKGPTVISAIYHHVQEVGAR